MSFLYQKPQRSKQSTSRRFRVAPYASQQDESDDVSLLLSGTKSMSSRTLERKTEAKQKAYRESLQGKLSSSRYCQLLLLMFEHSRIYQDATSRPRNRQT